jgi:hypothetical protein
MENFMNKTFESTQRRFIWYLKLEDDYLRTHKSIISFIFR